MEVNKRRRNFERRMKGRVRFRRERQERGSFERGKGRHRSRNGKGRVKDGPERIRGVILVNRPGPCTMYCMYITSTYTHSVCSTVSAYF